MRKRERERDMIQMIEEVKGKRNHVSWKKKMKERGRREQERGR